MTLYGRYTTTQAYGWSTATDFGRVWMSNCFNWTKTGGRFCLNIPLDKNKGGRRSVGADLTVLAQQVGWKYQSTIVCLE